MSLHIDLSHFLSATQGTEVVRLREAVRLRWEQAGTETIRDDFEESGAQCLFVRVTQPDSTSVQIRLAGEYRLKLCALGGWLLLPHAGEAIYWIPRLPSLRTLDERGRIITETTAALGDLDITPAATSVTFALLPSRSFDWAIWRFTRNTAAWLQELDTALNLELQPYFIFASHSVCSRAADYYLHMLHGHVYETLWAWPKKRKICDELDAYALYLLAAGLERSTGKALYGLLRQQVVASVLSRQDDNGGFRHGEWTDQFESHNRLINGGAQLLAAEMERTGDPVLVLALSKVAAYLSKQVDQTDAGAWFLHDSLEHSEAGMSLYPFAWIASTWLGKSPTNLLILNTHLDCMLALDRYRKLSGDVRYDHLLESAHLATQRVLAAQPANWLYKPLMWAIRLTLLPRAEQASQPLPLRALKRLVWKYLLPRWHSIRTRMPRFVMPDGYVERSLGQEGFVHRYHGVHLMDLARYQQRFTSPQLEAVLIGLVNFGVRSHITQHWKESPESRDTLGFWAEGLLQLCTQSRFKEYRPLLASAVIDLTDAGLGLPPSLLGANSEIVSYDKTLPCPSPADSRIRIVNLSVGCGPEFLAVNPAAEPITLAFDSSVPEGVVWRLPETGQPTQAIPARGWVVGSIESPEGFPP